MDSSRSAHDNLMQALDAYFESGGAEGGAIATGRNRETASGAAPEADEPPDLVTTPFAIVIG